MLPTTTIDNSDSEDDPDYVPNGHDSDNSDEHGAVETTAERALPESDVLEQKKQRDALWASFQASVSTPPPINANGVGDTVKRVKIEKTYLFAGKRVKNVVEVPEDSEEAKKWPRWSPNARPTSDSVPSSTPSSDKDAPAPSLAVDPSSPPPPTSTPAKRPGPRKPRTVLPSIPKGSQAKKITTIDKSAMDWHSHVASQSGDIKDELDANRRGGGYLEKVEFLKRVEDRRDDAFEASKSSKRRKM